MPITHEFFTFQASASLGAGASIDGPTFDHREKLGILITAKITNGATGPNTPPEFVVQHSTDNFVANVREIFRAGAKTTNAGVTFIAARVPPEGGFVRTRFENDDGQAITIEAEGSILKSVG
jgi:hypothetical protein